MVGRRKLIGIFATEIESRVQGNLYRELHEKAMENGYNLVLFSATFDKRNFTSTNEVSAEIFEIARKMNFAAFVIHAQSIGDAKKVNYIIEMGRLQGIPVFVYDCDTLGIAKSEGVITINPGYKEGFAQSVRHLIEDHKCRDIYMLAGNKGNKYSEDRIEVFKAEMAAHNIPFSEDQIGYGDFWEIPAMEAINKYLDSGKPTPQAICCANDSMAITAVNVLKSRGLRVPEDVLVTGFDGIENGKFNYPSISTCEPLLDEVADFVFDVIEGRKSDNEFLIPLKFYPKESSGCMGGDDSYEDRKEIARLMASMRQNSWEHHMLATMQFDLIDCANVDETQDYMTGILNIFNGYSHLFVIRDDIEYQTDYTEDFDKMRVHLNMNFLPKDKYSSFSIDKNFPDYDSVFDNMSQEDIFFFRMIFNANKKFGYSVVKTKQYSSNEINLLGQFSESFTNVLESILRNMRLKQATQKLNEMYERMSEIYIRDTLTGLYNRHGYYQDLEEYIAREDLKQGYVHIISIDMDGMKQINDNYGHLEGDNAIKAVAKTINECFSQPCISARFGGDEFTVALFTDTEQKPSAESISIKLNNYLKKLPQLADKEYEVKISVGKAVSKISEIEDFKSIEKLADDRMYSDKRKRKGEA